LGAPNLTDKTWLHGWGEASIVSMVQVGKINQMPAQKDRLTPSQMHALTAYVWAFSHHSDAPTKP
jgi:cytochrome c oxidase cbb3-type subunit 3